MKRYSEYKDSGVKWIGEIPGHWKCAQIGRLFSIKAGGDVKPDLFSDKQDHKHPYPVYTNTKSATDVYAYTSNPTCKANTITVTGRGEVGHAIFRETPYDAIIRLLSLESKSELANPKFHTYVIDTIIPFTSDSAAIGQLSAIQIKPKYIPVPTIKEQQAIVTYLDTKVAKIDEYISIAEKKISALEELKQTIIAEAVTRGIHKEVPMKDSGVFWQPQIPKSWSVTLIKHILYKMKRSRPINAEILICSNKGTVFKRGESKTGLISDDESIYQGVKSGDLLIHGMDTWHGAIAISNYNGMCTPVVHVCESTQNKAYIAYYLRNMATAKVFKLISNGVRQNTSDFRSWDKMGNVPVCLPPLPEQQEIVTYLDSKITNINQLCQAERSQIEKLKEYKQRLISDVVTGKVKVTND